MSETYYIISEIDRRKPGEAHSSVWPKLVAFSFSEKKLLLEEGAGHGLMGGTLPIEGLEVLNWKELFEETHSDWFMRSILDGVVKQLTSKKEFESFLLKNGCNIRTLQY